MTRIAQYSSVVMASLREGVPVARSLLLFGASNRVESLLKYVENLPVIIEDRNVSCRPESVSFALSLFHLLNTAFKEDLDIVGSSGSRCPAIFVSFINIDFRLR